MNSLLPVLSSEGGIIIDGYIIYGHNLDLITVISEHKKETAKLKDSNKKYINFLHIII